MMRVAALSVLMTLVACKKEEGEDPLLHACENIAEPGKAVDAAADRADAPAVSVSEEPFTVTLVDGSVGFVAVEVTEDTPAILFAGTADVVTALWHDDAEETLPTPAPNDDCPDDIPEHFDLDLHVGTWNIGVGPAGVAEVWLMLSPAGDHAHEE